MPNCSLFIVLIQSLQMKQCSGTSCVRGREILLSRYRHNSDITPITAFTHLCPMTRKSMALRKVTQIYKSMNIWRRKSHKHLQLCLSVIKVCIDAQAISMMLPAPRGSELRAKFRERVRLKPLFPAHQPECRSPSSCFSLLHSTLILAASP